jgi:hypothetical protein
MFSKACASDQRTVLLSRSFYEPLFAGLPVVRERDIYWQAKKGKNLQKEKRGIVGARVKGRNSHRITRVG